MTIGRSATTIYIYFRADPARTDEVLQAFSLHQAQLTRPRGALRLARRQEDAPGQVTWMEIYELGSSDLSVFKLELDRAAAQEKLPNPRRTELFVNC